MTERKKNKKPHDQKLQIKTEKNKKKKIKMNRPKHF